MRHNQPQETLKKQLKKLKQHIQDNNVEIYECSEQTIDSFLSNLGFINIHTKQGVAGNPKTGQTHQFFHEAGLTLIMEFDSLFASDPNHLKSSQLYFIGDRISLDFYKDWSGFTSSQFDSKEKVDIYGFPMDEIEKVSDVETRSNFVYDLNTAVQHFNLYQNPIQGMEFYFAHSIGLFENLDTVEQLQQDNVLNNTIQNYSGHFNPNQDITKKEFELSDPNDPLWIGIQAGINNHFSIKEMNIEMQNGFLTHIKKSFTVDKEDSYALSSTEQEFLEQAYLLITGQKSCQDIDPEWFQFQINDSINFLNTIASIHCFNSTIETIFYDVLNHTEAYYGQSTVQKLLFCHSDHSILTEQRSKQDIDLNQSVFNNLLNHRITYLPHVFSSLDRLLVYMEPEDLLKTINNKKQPKTGKKSTILETFIDNIKSMEHCLNSENFESIKINFLDGLTEKLCQSQKTVDYFKQLNQKPDVRKSKYKQASNHKPKKQQIKDYINNKMQHLLLNQDLENDYNSSHQKKKKTKIML